MNTQPLAKITKSEIIINKQVILDEIAKNKQFKDNDILIRKWEGEDDSNMYISNIIMPEMKFLGIVGGLLKRESYGINTFKNGDRYFGYFANDLREKHGIYEWKPVQKAKLTERELYYGLWKKDQRQDHGVYLWLSESKDVKPFSDFDKANFNAFVGEMNKDKMSRGVYMSKQGDSYYLYYGPFDDKGKKAGDKVFFYSSSEDLLMYGKAVNDQFHSGFTAKFNDDGHVQVIVKITEVGKEDVPAKIITQENIPKEELEEARNIMVQFRNVILGVDYFGFVYKKFNQITSFMDNEMKNLDILDSSDGFAKIMKIAPEHHEMAIFKEIEKHIFNRY